MTLDERLKSLRKSKGITQKELADAIDVSVQSINKWENAKGLPDAINLLNIACYYEVSIDYLMDHEVSSKLKHVEVFCFKKFREYAKSLVLSLLKGERN